MSLNFNYLNYYEEWPVKPPFSGTTECRKPESAKIQTEASSDFSTKLDHFGKKIIEKRLG